LLIVLLHTRPLFWTVSSTNCCQAASCRRRCSAAAFQAGSFSGLSSGFAAGLSFPAAAFMGMPGSSHDPALAVYG
jgi:hypothetical protein